MRLAPFLALLVVTGAARADEPLVACHAMPATAKLRVSLQPHLTLDEVAAWVIGFTCKSVVFSDESARRARVTILAPGELTPRQAYQLFVDALRTQDLVVTERGDTVIITDAPGARRCPPAPAGAEAPEPVVDDGIRAVDERHATITRAARDKLLDDVPALARTARFVPSFKEGKNAGFKIYAIRPGAALQRLGLANGDTVLTVNGAVVTIDSAQRLLELLRTADTITLGLQRRGEDRTLEILVVP